jgi:cell division protein FtsB
VWHGVAADHDPLLTWQLTVSYPRWAMPIPTDPEPSNREQPDLGESAPRGDLSAIPSFLRSRARGDERGADIPEPAWPIRQPQPVLGAAPDPTALRMAGISPRRLLQIVAVVAIAWGVVSFGRQVASATAASAHAADLRAANADLQDEVSAMQRELALIQERRYIDQQARAYRLGTAKEIPFALEAGAPALPADAPGSASNRLGADAPTGGPLDHWLELLFGPG